MHRFFFHFCLLLLLFYPIQEQLKYLNSNIYSEFSWPVFSGMQTEYRDLPSKSLYSVRIRENMDQKNSEYGNVLHSDGETNHS